MSHNEYTDGDGNRWIREYLGDYDTLDLSLVEHWEGMRDGYNPRNAIEGRERRGYE